MKFLNNLDLYSQKKKKCFGASYFQNDPCLVYSLNMQRKIYQKLVNQKRITLPTITELHKVGKIHMARSLVEV